MDLPEGDYTLRATLPYRSTRWQVPEKATVAVDGTIPPAWLNFIFPTTGVVGKVMPDPKSGSSDKASPESIAQAHIRVRDSDEQTWSDRKGHFQLLNLEAPDPRSPDPQRPIVLEITADGYDPQTKTYDIKRGTVNDKTIYLTPISSGTDTSSNS